MPDDKNNISSRDVNQNSVTEDDEVQYWTKTLGISKLKLEAVIKKHGNSAWLRKYRPPALEPNADTAGLPVTRRRRGQGR